ncbi:thiamine phosphate synthase [Mucilaginibacter sp. SG564]|uniref:thiamine phosphate synthase n=1 Tax=Mucilaginibacter sp. SG564 TaxID=2587022 RepID=UPI001557D71C|nr:thiamine phosphate synthase [Mucilaginibacter sp. SG564]NOW93768.1 thiamine-phosphate pyrophosphorylase [Mucilaginibacter sp. SG564]
MQLIVISYPQQVINEAAIINQLFEAGLKRYHLRKPAWDETQLVDLLQQIDHAFYPQITLHQQHHIASDFDIKKLHYTEKHRLDTEPGKLILKKEEGYVLSTSIHNINELSSLPPFDYTFFGPVFNSISKPDYQSQLPDNFQLPPNTATQVIALGGVGYANLHKVKHMGFDGAAVLGTIWNNPAHAITNFNKLQEHLLIKQT